MNDQIERIESLKSGQRARNFLFRIFPGSIKRRDVAVPEPGPMDRTLCRRERANLAVEIDEAESLAERTNVVMRLVVAGQHPQAFAQRLKRLAAFFQAL